MPLYNLKFFYHRKKLIKLRHLVKRFHCITIRTLASLIGLIIHAFNAVTYGQLHYRNLEKDQIKHPRLNYDGFNAFMTVSEASKSDIKWWLENVELENGKLIRQSYVNEWLQTDASLKGWGAICNQNYIGERWSSEESNHHINYLEPLAIFLGLKSFYKNVSDKHVGIKSDNSTAVAYINNMGGMQSNKLDDLAITIWSWCKERSIFLTAVHVPGVENTGADYKSRIVNDSHEWMLKKDIFVTSV